VHKNKEEKEKFKEGKKKKGRNKTRTLRACPFEDKVGFGSFPLRNNRPLK
jgi:hypothetical protein